MSGRTEPLSIESLLQNQKAEKEAASKPKFLSKEERATLAIAKRAQEIKQQTQRDALTKKDRETLEREADDIRRNNTSSRFQDDRYSHPPDRGRHSQHSNRGHDRRHQHQQQQHQQQQSPRTFPNVPTGPKADRMKGVVDSSQGSMGPPPPPSGPSSSMPPPPVPQSASNSQGDNFNPPMTDNDLSAIRSRYLGVDKKKRKIRKMNDRKFVFDWDAQDDTLAGDSPSVLGSERQGAQVMFGRGHIAGMDDAGASQKGSSSLPGHLADPMERRKAARNGLDERHWTEKPLEQMKERDWRIFREDFSISARGGTIPHPLRSWRESSIPETILQCIDEIGYKEPSAIQRQAIPIGMQNRDIIGIAETGSGKTAAFVIPMLAFISQLPPFTDDIRHMGPYALILAPTRELAQQIEKEAMKFATPLGFKCVSIVGGRAVEEQQFNLREGAEIIIATPGRLKDVIERHVLVLSQCRYIVMDEADRMVNLGFEVDLLFILDSLPSETMDGEDIGHQMDVDTDGEMIMKKKGRTRVTTLFSATMPPPVERLARKYLKSPATITIGEAGRAVDTVEQRVEFAQGDEKKKIRLLEILNSNEFGAPIIVFVNQKKTADMVAKDLSRAGWSAATLHSGKNQEQREASLQSLRDGHSDILVATDLAGRGIDVQDVSLVINFQMANSIESYVHRIGRTGRAGKLGTAITFLTNEDDEVMYELKNEISKSPVSKVPPELARHEAAQHKVTREMKRKRDPDEVE